MKLIILGGGFGGLRLANLLSNKEGIDITLIDRFNYHQFQPLFYQVATSKAWGRPTHRSYTNTIRINI